MLSVKEFSHLYETMRNTDPCGDQADLTHVEQLQTNMIDYLRVKFQETSVIFKKFDTQGIYDFCKLSQFLTYEDSEKVFKKGEDCKNYLFIMNGDIQIYEDEVSNKILKTVTSGTLIGHKVKHAWTKTGVAKNQTLVLCIEKTVLNDLIEKINQRKEREKFMLIKKYLPKIRLFSDDIIESLKPYFIKEDHFEGSRIFLDNEFDEYVYIVAKGSVGCLKSITKIPNLKENLALLGENYTHYSHVVLERFKRGDVFGIFSALKHQKNNYTAEVLSPKASIYKIAKAHVLMCFGGSFGMLPNALRGLDTIQQISLRDKIDFLSRISQAEDHLAALQRFEFRRLKEDFCVEPKIIVDEAQISNFIKDAWKELENMDAKVSDFKANLLKGPAGKPEVASNILNKFKEKEKESDSIIMMTLDKDYSKIMGMGTNRVVGKQLNKTGLTSNQLKGMNMLKSICDVKKQPSTNLTAPVEEKKQLDNNKVAEGRRPSRLKNLMEMEVAESRNDANIDKAHIQNSVAGVEESKNE